jgi:hypothetical protein
VSYAHGFAVGALVVGACIAACGGSPSPAKSQAAVSVAQPAPRPIGSIIVVGKVPAEIAEMTKTIWARVSEWRELQPTENVRLRVESGPWLIDHLREKEEKETPREKVIAEGKAFAALGLIPADFDYEREMTAILERELAGVYLPDEKTIYVSTESPPKALEYIVAHELVHALQDQYFDLTARMKLRGEPGAAIHAMAEGDAMATLPAPPEADGFAEDKPSSMQGVPPFIEHMLNAPYFDGRRFIMQLRRRGGWQAVNDAWKTPPQTTEQLLHIEKYDAHEPFVDVKTIPHQTLVGYTGIYDEVFGEQQGRVAFAEWNPPPVARKIAEGWGGDRANAFEKAGVVTIAWVIQYDSASDSQRAFDALSTNFEGILGPSQTIEFSSETTLVVWGGKFKGIVPKKGQLPLLPGPGAKKSAAPSGITPGFCRSLRIRDTQLTLLSHVPCDIVVDWAKEF